MQNIEIDKVINKIESDVTNLLKENVDLKHEINTLKETNNDQFKEFALDFISILDSLEIKFENYNEKLRNNTLSNESKKIILNFKTIERKIIRILENHGISEINFKDNKAKLGLCKVVETQKNLLYENEHILYFIKKGYKTESQVIRPAEVITVKN